MFYVNGYSIWWNSLQDRWMVQSGYQVMKRLVNKRAAIRYAQEH